MLSELTGFTLSRTLPDNAMLGVLSGAYKVYGGVVRNDAGHIVAHLVGREPQLGLEPQVRARIVLLFLRPSHLFRQSLQ